MIGANGAGAGRKAIGAGTQANAYEITMAGEEGLVVISPEMVALLVEKVQGSEGKELYIPAQEILPQGYAEYLACVLAANPSCTRPAAYGMVQDVYGWAAGQMEQLSVGQQKCFDIVRLYGRLCQMQFYLYTSEAFYSLAKQKRIRFVYTYSEILL